MKLGSVARVAAHRTSLVRAGSAVITLVALCLISTAIPATADARSERMKAMGWNEEPQWDVHFPPGIEMVEIPFHSVKGGITIDVKVNGSTPLRFLLDTGWPNAAILDPEKLEGIELDFHDAKQGHNSQLRIARNVRFEVGDLRIEKADMEVMPKEQLAHLGLPEDGILGGQFFAGLVVQIDWREERIRLYDPSSFEAPAGVPSVPIENKTGMIYLSADATVDGESRQVRLVVDTGANGALSLRADKVAAPEQQLSGLVLGKSVFGDVTGALGRVDLKLGGSRVEGVLTLFLDQASSIIAVGSDGNLGTQVMRRFVVTFDYARKRMLLEPTEAITEPFRFTTSGIRLAQQIASDGSLAVSQVYANTPAERAGIAAGDRIVSVNSQPVEALGRNAVRDQLRQAPGTLVSIEVERNGERREIKLKLETIL